MKEYDVVGIGAGPVNLSLAALLTKTKKINAMFLEKQEDFIWHEGMLLPEAKLQVPFLNDLVTLVDPTNPYSFLNFLSSHNRLYQFIAADFNPILRIEFSQYLRWVFNQLRSINKGKEVIDINFNGKIITVSTKTEQYHTKNLVLGTGQSPFVPKTFQAALNKDVYHNSNYMSNIHDHKKKRIAIIGGGQSGAEIIEHLISDNQNLPKEIFWISKNSNFLPLDDTPFTNEIFTPNYIKYFHNLDDNKKKILIQEQNLASNGISEYTAKSIYQKMYEIKFLRNQETNFNLLPSNELMLIEKINDEYLLTIKDCLANINKKITVDKVILCTGYNYQPPNFLLNLDSTFKNDSQELTIDSDYRISWKGMKDCSIFLQNGATHTHGVSDSTLSIAAFRSATIINTIAREAIYPNIEGFSLIHWGM